LRRKNQH